MAAVVQPFLMLTGRRSVTSLENKALHAKDGEVDEVERAKKGNKSKMADSLNDHLRALKLIN